MRLRLLPFLGYLMQVERISVDQLNYDGLHALLQSKGFKKVHFEQGETNVHASTHSCHT
jgi:hypothetical protein